MRDSAEARATILPVLLARQYSDKQHPAQPRQSSSDANPAGSPPRCMITNTRHLANFSTGTCLHMQERRNTQQLSQTPLSADEAISEHANGRDLVVRERRTSLLKHGRQVQRIAQHETGQIADAPFLLR